jgi:hypothetical protein
VVYKEHCQGKRGETVGIKDKKFSKLMVSTRYCLLRGLFPQKGILKLKLLLAAETQLAVVLFEKSFIKYPGQYLQR